MKNMNLYIREAQQTLSTINSKTSFTSHIILKRLTDILENTKRKMTLQVPKYRIRLIVDLRNNELLKFLYFL